MKKYKVRIKDMPNMAYGGQRNFGLDLGQRILDNQMTDDSPYQSVGDTLQPVPREMANLEAERGETVVGDVDGDGIQEHMKIGGKRHSQGGTPLNLKPGSFIYSDTKKMRIAGAPLEMFGKNPEGSKKYTPAQLAKQYDLNKYKAMLEDPLTDPLKKKTAEMMMTNNQKKLGQLALLQESMKGFPNGIPDVAMSAMPQAAYGGSTFSGNAWFGMGGVLPKAQNGIEAYPGDKYSGVKNASKYSTEQLRELAAKLGLGSQDSLALQRDMLDIPEVKEIVEAEHQAKGMPYADRMDDGMWGYRWDAALEKAVQKAAMKKIQLPTINKPGLPTLTRPGTTFAANPRTTTNTAEEAAPITGPQAGQAGNKYTMPHADYLLPDKLAGLQALATRATMPTIKPFMATPGYVKPSATFMDPTRDYAANAEMANMQMQGMRSFGRPQQFLAGASQIAGRTIAANEGAAGAVNKQNVMLANQYEQQGAQMDNQYLANRAQANNLYAEMANNALKENFRNTNAADNQVLASFNNAWNNRAMVDGINATNPYFMIDSRTGFANLKDPNRDILSMIRGAKGADAATPMTYPELLNYATKTLKLPSDKAEAWVLEQMKTKGRTTTTDKNNDGYPDFTQVMNPFMQMMQGMRQFPATSMTQ